MHPDIGRAVVRWGLGLVLVWFGIHQLVTPDWFYGYVPGWLPLEVATVVFLNGLVDGIVGLALLVGVWPRVAGVIAALHLLVIMAHLGYNDALARDFGLTTMAVAIAIWNGDRYCLKR